MVLLSESVSLCSSLEFVLTVPCSECSAGKINYVSLNYTLYQTSHYKDPCWPAETPSSGHIASLLREALTAAFHLMPGSHMCDTCHRYFESHMHLEAHSMLKHNNSFCNACHQSVHATTQAWKRHLLTQKHCLNAAPGGTSPKNQLIMTPTSPIISTLSADGSVPHSPRDEWFPDFEPPLQDDDEDLPDDSSGVARRLRLCPLFLPLIFTPAVPVISKSEYMC